MRKLLVTCSFAVDGIDDEYLATFVASVEMGLRRGIAMALQNRPDGMSREEAMRVVEEFIEFYGATVTLQRPLFAGDVSGETNPEA